MKPKATLSETEIRSSIVNLPVTNWLGIILEAAPIVLSIVDKLLGRSNYKTKLDKISYLISVYPDAAGVPKLRESINLILNEK